MKKLYLFLLSFPFVASAQQLGNFISVTPSVQSADFVIPSTHTFQKIIENGDVLTAGGTMPDNHDFTGYVPINGSSTNGYLSVNSELNPGGVTILDINYNASTKLWEKTASQKVDFSSVAGTANNCSGTVTPWNTIITCEETVTTSDNNGDGYHDLGWCVEINPVTKTVINKRWALGKFNHENVAIHSNRRTVYQGIDTSNGYLYKFVATNAEDLSDGILYVYKGSKNGSGNWILINNTSIADRNTTVSQSTAAGATLFSGIEDVEIGPDGWIYFAVKNENRVYRLQDSDPITGTTVPQMETFVGNASYNILDNNGITTTTNWGSGNDNLAFDEAGNLWVLQDGSNNHIWVVENGHTQANPKVKLFGKTPIGSEPTGITFSPDYKFLFMSLQHPSSSNNSTLVDASGSQISFNKDITLVIALKSDLGGSTLSTSYNELENTKIKLYPNPVKNIISLDIDKSIGDLDIDIYDLSGKLVKSYRNTTTKSSVNLDFRNFENGFYFIRVKNKIDKKVIMSKKFMKISE